MFVMKLFTESCKIRHSLGVYLIYEDFDFFELFCSYFLNHHLSNLVLFSCLLEYTGQKFSNGISYMGIGGLLIKLEKILVNLVLKGLEKIFHIFFSNPLPMMFNHR